MPLPPFGLMPQPWLFPDLSAFGPSTFGPAAFGMPMLAAPWTIRIAEPGPGAPEGPQLAEVVAPGGQVVGRVLAGIGSLPEQLAALQRWMPVFPFAPASGLGAAAAAMPPFMLLALARVEPDRPLPRTRDLPVAANDGQPEESGRWLAVGAYGLPFDPLALLAGAGAVTPLSLDHGVPAMRPVFEFWQQAFAHSMKFWMAPFEAFTGMRPLAEPASAKPAPSRSAPAEPAGSVAEPARSSRSRRPATPPKGGEPA